LEEQDRLGKSPADGTSNISSQGRKPAKPNIAPAPFAIVPIRKRQRYLKMLIYGEYGVGKTTLAASAAFVPDMCDVLLIDAESGDMSIEDIDSEHIDTVPVSNHRQFARLHEFLGLHCAARDKGDEDALWKLQNRFAPEINVLRKYKTVIIDSLTEVQKMAMYQLLGIKVGEHSLDIEPDSPQFKEWNTSSEMILLLVRSFRDLPMNVIVVCSQDVEIDDKKRMYRTPALPGKLSSRVQGFFDCVGYYVAGAANEGGEIQRRLWLQPGKTFHAKNRFPRFDGAYVDDPDMFAIYELFKGRN